MHIYIILDISYYVYAVVELILILDINSYIVVWLVFYCLVEFVEFDIILNS